MSKSLQLAHIEGVEAAKAGRPHDSHRYHRPEELPEAIAWSHGWLLTRVQRETGLILLPAHDGAAQP